MQRFKNLFRSLVSFCKRQRQPGGPYGRQFFGHAFKICALLVTGVFVSQIAAQPKVTAWGNVNGIRVEGHPFEFQTRLCVVGQDLMHISKTAKEQQRPDYTLNENKQIISTDLSGIRFHETVRSIGRGTASLTIRATAQKDTVISGAFVCVEMTGTDYSDGSIQLIDSSASQMEQIPLFANRDFRRRMTVQASVKGVRFVASDQQLEVLSDERTEIIIQRGSRWFGAERDRVYFGILTGKVEKEQTGEKSFTLKVTGNIDDKPIHLTVDASNPGRAFDGIGGNFRLQNPDKDPMVIDYCLENLNITWGRVEMPWRSWHPNEDINPVNAAQAGDLDHEVHAAMKMAQRLAMKDIPVIVSAWFPPRWAIIEGTENREQGLYGHPLDQKKMESIIKSIGSYLIYLKDHYGVEADMFSFNESDLGINIRQTGEEHAELIKTLGSYLASHGLMTKMLLGDNSDANTYAFVRPALNERKTHKFIDAVSFHSWRGTDNWTLSIWADIAEELNIPLLIGEGSIDAAAYRYPDIFRQFEYAFEEIDTYVRILAICQAKSILQWQLTSDYSVLTGAGIYGTDGPLRPTQRFWNLNQLGITPSGSFNLPVKCDRPNVSCVAFGDIAENVYSVHIVNNGAERRVILDGLPESASEFSVYITDDTRDMKKGTSVSVSNGQAKFTLKAAAYTTLINR